jgi:hypothetical protein
VWKASAACSRGDADHPLKPNHLTARTGEANQCGDCYVGAGAIVSAQRVQSSTGGSMRKNVLATLILALLVTALSAIPALAVPGLWTNKTETLLLRSVKTPPMNQPDALEFANQGTVAFILTNAKGEQKTIACNEIEFGTTVLANRNVNKAGEPETKLALPFGVAEGDECTTPNTAGSLEPVPTYFDTLANGAVPVVIAITGGPGPPFFATFKQLKFSQNIGGLFCTENLAGIVGEVSNGAEPFVEEMPPNLSVGLKGSGPVTCGGKKAGTVEIIARFFLETMSTTTDTAWIGP